MTLVTPVKDLSKEGELLAIIISPEVGEMQESAELIALESKIPLLLLLLDVVCDSFASVPAFTSELGNWRIGGSPGSPGVIQAQEVSRQSITSSL